MHCTAKLRGIMTSLGRVGDPSPGYATAAVSAPSCGTMIAAMPGTVIKDRRQR
jgi:hypothetical protein